LYSYLFFRYVFNGAGRAGAPVRYIKGFRYAFDGAGRAGRAGAPRPSFVSRAYVMQARAFLIFRNARAVIRLRRNAFTHRKKHHARHIKGFRNA
jgi:hypothetical protein